MFLCSISKEFSVVQIKLVCLELGDICFNPDVVTKEKPVHDFFCKWMDRVT